MGLGLQASALRMSWALSTYLLAGGCCHCICFFSFLTVFRGLVLGVLGTEPQISTSLPGAFPVGLAAKQVVVLSGPVLAVRLYEAAFSGGLLVFTVPASVASAAAAFHTVTLVVAVLYQQGQRTEPSASRLGGAGALPELHPSPGWWLSDPQNLPLFPRFLPACLQFNFCV